MATAKLRKKTVTVMAPIPKEVVDGVTLELTTSEAKALRYTLGLIGGNNAREFTAAIVNVLEEVGIAAVQWNWQREQDGKPPISEGNIHFLEGSKEAFQ